MEQRQYPLSDTAMATFAALHRQLFIDHQIAFTDFDADFGSPTYETDWQTAIDATLNVGTAESRDDQLSGRTAQVEAAMKAITLKVKDVKYFAFKTFPPEGAVENRSILDEFGFDDYDAVYGSQEGIRIFMKQMFKVATQYAAPMAAKGFTAAKLDAINTVTNAFLALDVAQDAFNQSSPIDTLNRVRTHNHTWSFSTAVRRATEVMYAEDPVMYNLFLLPRRAENVNLLNVIGNISAMGSGSPVVGATATIVELGISTTTDEDGNFGYAQIVPGNYTLRITAPGFMLMDVPFIRQQTKLPTVVNAALVPMPPMPPTP